MKPLLKTILSRELHDPKVVIYNWLDEYDIKNYTINNKGEIDVDGDVNLSRCNLTEFPSFIQFDTIKGNFDCIYNNLTSLKGSPRKVGGHFDCSYNELTTLKESPKEVGGSFNCTYNKLTSLEGSPKEVGGSFNCSRNNLTSLEGAPEIVEKYFYCNRNKVQFTEDDVRRVCKVGSEISV